MKNKKLLHSIGQIDENLIIEADATRFAPRKGKFFLHLAACLALVCCLGLVIAVPRFLPKQEPAAPLVGQTETLPPPQTSDDFSFDGLTANSSQEEVLELFGEPKQIADEDSPRWFYPSFTIQFHHADQLPCRIWLLQGCDLTMPNGIKVGSSEEDLQTAYPEALTMQDYPKTHYLQDAFPDDIEGYTDDPLDTLYQINTEEQTLQIGVHDGEVEFIYLYRYISTSEEPYTDAEEPYTGAEEIDFIYGNLALDLTQEQVRAALGEPEQIWNKESLCWVYPTLMLRFHSFDDTVSQISTMAGCEITLPNGIGLGSSEEYVKEAFPDAYVNPKYNENNADTCYEVYSGSKTLLIGTADGEVVYMSLTCHEDPMLKALTASEITIYTPVDAGRSWESVTVGGKEAKGICTVLTISEPEEASVEKSEITYWLDFGNGTALSLYGNDCASIYSYSGEALDPSRTDGLTWRLNGRFLDLDNYVIRAIISSR